MSWNSNSSCGETALARLVIARLPLFPWALVSLSIAGFATALVVTKTSVADPPAATGFDVSTVDIGPDRDDDEDDLIPDFTTAEEEPAEEETPPPAGQPPRQKLVIGDAYMLEVKRGGISKSFGGNLLAANNDWIVLRRVAGSRNDYGVPLLSGLPKVGNYFRRSYESMVEDDLWIPREAAAIQQHHRVNTAPAQHTVGKNPPSQSHCAIAFAHEDKFVRRDGDLKTVNPETVSVMLTTPFHSQYEQQISRKELLCISVPVVLSKIRMTEKDKSATKKN